MPVRSGMIARLPFLGWKRWKLSRYLESAQRAADIQQSVLLEKLQRHATSDFGRRHRFAEIRSIASFRENVPITDYEYVRPYIERVMQGETGAMFAEGTKVLMFATTSGTTNLPKYLPVTDQFYREYKQSWQYWGTGVYRDYPRMLGKSTLQFSSHWRISHTPAGIPCGNISGLAAETRPVYMRSLFVLPAEVIQIMDHEAKHYTALRLSLASRRVGMVITANPSTLVEVAKRADRERESIIRDIFDGTLSQKHNIPAPIREALRGSLQADRARAKELEKIVERSGHLYPRDAWPELDLIAVWTGGSVGIYLSQLHEFYGDVPIRDHGISASEGRMTVPLENGTSSGLLDFFSHYYEFIPEQQREQPDHQVLRAHELTPGENYFILLTTSSGLYRYDISDVVRCDGYLGQAPLLSFLNKGKHFSSYTGEKLSEHQVVQAMRQSLEKLGLESCTFTLAPQVDVRPRYHLILAEGEQSRVGERLASEMQQQLEEINQEYGDKCRTGRIDPIRLMEVPSDTWQRLRRAKSRERGNFEEYKHPCLTSDLKFIDQLKALVET